MHITEGVGKTYGSLGTVWKTRGKAECAFDFVNIRVDNFT